MFTSVHVFFKQVVYFSYQLQGRLNKIREKLKLGYIDIMANKYTMSYVRSDTSHRKIDCRNFIDCLKVHSETKADENAFVFVSTDENRQCVTWKQLYDRACLVGKSRINLGVNDKQIVGISLRTCPEWLYATFGAMVAGAIPVSVSFTYTDGSDVIALMEKMKCCTILIMDPGLDGFNWAIMKNLLEEYDRSGSMISKQIPSIKLLIGHAFEQTDAQVKPFQDLLNESHSSTDLPDIYPDDIATLLQTSGSTGIPKLVVFNHDSFIRFAESGLVIFDERHRCFNDRPFTWLGGFPLSVITGMSRVTMSGFCKPPENKISFMIDTIIKEKCTSTLAMPLLTNELIRRQHDLPSDWPLQVLMTGGQPITKSLTKCIGNACKSLCCLYGSTEALLNTQSIVSDPENFTEYSCGKVLHAEGLEMKIVDGKGEIVPVNTTGELYVRSLAMFRGYLNDEEKTRLAITDDGWYKTDDMGLMNENGEFFVRGRKSNMIISGGMNVAPEILEQALRKLPGVESVVIVPVPDPIAYQLVCACVIRKAGSQLTEEQLRKSCEEQHADKPGLFTVLPKFYMFVDKYPETRTGKTCRKELEKMAGNLFCSSAKNSD